jgi:hypothetical protein
MNLFNKKKIITGPVCKIEEKMSPATRDWIIVLSVFSLLTIAILSFIFYSNVLINGENFSFLTTDKNTVPVKIDEKTLNNIEKVFKDKDANYESLQK